MTPKKVFVASSFLNHEMFNFKDDQKLSRDFAKIVLKGHTHIAQKLSENADVFY